MTTTGCARQVKDWPVVTVSRVVAVSVVVLTALCLPALAAEIIVGVLERPPCKQESPAAAVRPLFHKRGDLWVALSSQDAANKVLRSDMSWTVVLHGKHLGSIDTVDPGFSSLYSWAYPRDRLLTLASGHSIPAVTNDERRFGNWCGVPEERPLVVISEPYFTDPQRWYRLNPDSGLRDRLFSHFSAVAGEASTCESQDDGNRSVWIYSANDLLFSDSYRDDSGRKVVALSLSPERNQCDGPPDDAWLTHWFLIDDSIRPLGANLSFVDAADYDADNNSELLFWYSRYNRDGYLLFYDGLRRYADFQWSYH